MSEQTPGQPRATGILKVKSLTWLRVAHRLARIEERWPRFGTATNFALRRALQYEDLPR